MKNYFIVKIANSIRKSFGYQFPRLGRLAMDLFYRLMPDKFDAQLFPGINAVLSKQDLTQRSTYWQGKRFENPTATILESWITEDTTHFFDIGSNYGFFSYWMLTRSKSIIVNSFEPNPSTYSIVREIKRRNNLARLHPWNIGLGESASILALHLGTVDSGHSTFGENPELHASSIATIEVKPFSLWLTESGMTIPSFPAWIAKIDVEGFELKVLTGMEAALRAKAIQGSVIEFNEYTLGFCNTKASEIFSFLESCGYKQMLIHPCGNAFYIPA